MRLIAAARRAAAEVTPACGGRPSSVTMFHICETSRHLPQGEGLHTIASVQDLHRRRGVNAIPYRGYNPSVKTYGFATSPYTGEARIALQTRGVSLAQGGEMCA